MPVPPARPFKSGFSGQDHLADLAYIARDACYKYQQNGAAVYSDNLRRKQHPTYPSSWKISSAIFANNLGHFSARLGNYRDALQSYDKSIELDPNSAITWNNKGSVLIKLKKYKKALQAFDESIRLDPNDAITWSNKGYVLEALGNYKKALQAYDESIRLCPNETITWNNKGSVLKKLGRSAGSRAAYAKAKELSKVKDLLGYNGRL